MRVTLHAVAVVQRVMRPGRVQVVRLGDMPNGYEVSIRTPVTPPRWEDFHEVRSAGFEDIMCAIQVLLCTMLYALAAAFTRTTCETAGACNQGC